MPPLDLSAGVLSVLNDCLSVWPSSSAFASREVRVVRPRRRARETTSKDDPPQLRNTLQRSLHFGSRGLRGSTFAVFKTKKRLEQGCR